MRKLWRSLLLCWMVLALPLQGMAAVAMLHCAGGSMPAPGMAAQGLQGHDHSLHLHHQHHRAAAVDPAQQAGPALAADLALAADPADPPSPAGHKCSACSACCAGMALPASMAPLSVPELSCTPAWVSASSSLSFIASGPERPPRQTLA